MTAAPSAARYPLRRLLHYSFIHILPILMSVRFNSARIITLLWISAEIALTGLFVTSETYMSIAVTRSSNKTARRPEEHSAGKHIARVVSCKLRTSWLRFRSMTRSLPLARFRRFYGLARAAEDKVHSGKLVDFSFFCGAGRRRRRRTRRSGSGRKQRGRGAVVRPQEGETFSFQQCPKAHDLSLSTLCQAWPSFRCVLRATSVAAREQALPPSLGPSARGGLPPSGRAGRSRYNYILQPRGIFADFPMSPPPASASSCARARRPTNATSSRAVADAISQNS